LSSEAARPIVNLMPSSRGEPASKKHKRDNGSGSSSDSVVGEAEHYHPWMVTMESEIARMTEETQLYNSAAAKTQEYINDMNEIRVGQRTNFRNWYKEDRDDIATRLEPRKAPANTVHQTRVKLADALFASNVPPGSLGSLVELTMTAPISYIDETAKIPPESDLEGCDALSWDGGPGSDESHDELEELDMSINTDEAMRYFDIFKVNGQLALCNQAWWPSSVTDSVALRVPYMVTAAGAGYSYAD
jgi:hypothetical protein